MAYRIRPSAAGAWSKCLGYISMSERYPELPGIDDSVREEGTAGHWVAQKLGQGFIVPEGALAPNGVEVDSEMIEGAELYVNVLRSWRIPVYQEMSLSCSRIHEQCGGTADAWGVDHAKKLIRLADFKYGYRLVEVFECLQLVVYAAGIVDFLKLNGHDEQEWAIEFTIVQPRAFGGEPVRTWHTRVANLRGLWNLLSNAAHGAMQPDPVCTPGEHCEHCSGARGCKALHIAGGRAIEISAKAIPNDLSAEAAGVVLQRVTAAISHLEAMQDGLEQQMLHAMQSGHVDRHWEIGHGQSREVWKDEQEVALLALADILGVAAAKPRRAKTPKQVKQLMDPVLVDRFAETRPGRKKLIPFNEQRARKLLS